MKKQKTETQAAVSWQPELVLTPRLIDDFIAHLKEKNYIKGTMNRYERDLRQFYVDLPEDKCVHRGTLANYREKLLTDGYAPQTANLCISAANSLFRYLGLKEYQLDNQIRPKNENLPEISRSEYLRRLRTARALGWKCEYLLIKLFASTGITTMEVPKVTVEAVKTGHVEIQPNNKQVLHLPHCLQKELLDYAVRNGIYDGPIFLSRGEKAIKRSNITQKIHRVCIASGVPEEKGNLRCLKKLYQTARAVIEANFDLLVEQALDRQMEAEQVDVGWKENEGFLKPKHKRINLRREKYTNDPPIFRINTSKTWGKFMLKDKPQKLMAS